MHRKNYYQPEARDHQGEARRPMSTALRGKNVSLEKFLSASEDGFGDVILWLG
jgi:hypothetical protein